ncbi:D-alanyl-D-alanine carboxypeptidase family protein [uncultured Limosilactobacillus sp.]|uniref:D-alanyl-D-alanine carboxypeptidase family protein n=1 Tax=uncultured Limosilactobacillus sp. TaxID=2837629 RepID=UPI0025D89A2D|nr:D-alanyl-D-alanine carboxypeptidase family protein [uncultured Limosilactobacillus sp.]
MKRIKRGLISLFITIVTVCGTLFGGLTIGHAAPINASAAFAIDAQTGQVLYNHNGDQRLAVASMSKLLTVAVIENEISTGQLKWSTKVKITPAEAKLSTAQGYSNVPLKAGKKYSVKQLTEAALIKSGDAATIALTRAKGQNTQQFVKQMGIMADRLGLKNFRLYNGVGLENKDMSSFKLPNTSATAENQMTARDVAKVARYLIRNYPAVLKITQRQTLMWDGKSYQNSNELLPGNAKAPEKIKVDGLKTGTSDKAGQCLVSTGTYHGHRIITVVMHAKDRFVQTKALYREIFTKWRPVTTKSVQTVRVSHGQQKNVQVTTKHRVTIWHPQQATIKPQFIADAHKKAGQKLKAPLKRDTRVGKLRYSQLKTVNNQPLQFGVYPVNDVKRSGLLGWLGSLF